MIIKARIYKRTPTHAGIRFYVGMTDITLGYTGELVLRNDEADTLHESLQSAPESFGITWKIEDKTRKNDGNG